MFYQVGAGSEKTLSDMIEISWLAAASVWRMFLTIQDRKEVWNPVSIMQPKPDRE